MIMDNKEYLNKRNYTNFKNARKRLKERLVEYKGGKCEICGYNRCISALEFHHLDPSQKDFAICSGDVKSYETMRKEVDKCILVCANCHREIHEKEHKEIDRKYLEEEKRILADIMVQRENGKHCKIKNSYEILKYTDVFKDIENGMPREEIFKKYHINNKTFNKFLKENNINYFNANRALIKPTKEELEKLLKTNSKTSIGRIFGVSCGAVIKWCKKYEIPLKEDKEKE